MKSRVKAKEGYQKLKSINGGYGKSCMDFFYITLSNNSKYHY